MVCLLEILIHVIPAATGPSCHSRLEVVHDTANVSATLAGGKVTSAYNTRIAIEVMPHCEVVSNLMSQNLTSG